MDSDAFVDSFMARLDINFLERRIYRRILRLIMRVVREGFQITVFGVPLTIRFGG